MTNVGARRHNNETSRRNRPEPAAPLQIQATTISQPPPQCTIVTICNVSRNMVSQNQYLLVAVRTVSLEYLGVLMVANMTVHPAKEVATLIRVNS